MSLLLTSCFLFCAAAFPRIGSVASGDTRIRVKASDDGLTIVELASKPAGRNWAGGEAELRLVPFAWIGGKRLALSWRLISMETSKAERRLTFHFASDGGHLTARSDWVAARGKGPIEHVLTLDNDNDDPVTLPKQTSLTWSFSSSPHLESWWVEKGAGGPSNKGVHKSSIGPGFIQTLLSEPYVSNQRAYEESGTDRAPIPWITVHDRVGGGWYAGIEFSGRVSLEVRATRDHKVVADLGLADEPQDLAEFRTILRPRTPYALPTVFVGCYRGEVEDGCNVMHRWVDTELRPKASDARYPLLTLNSWGSGMAIDAALGRSMMQNAKKLGMEMFHVDAGWFKGVGDWRSNSAKFPHGVSQMGDEAHALGLKFGLWVGWTQGGIMPVEDSRMVLNVHDPVRADWIANHVPLDWKPADFVGADLCLGDLNAVDWCKQMLERVIDENHLDMLEHDQRMIVDECVRTDHMHTSSRSDIAYWAAQGYYSVYDALRATHPDLLFENCVNGGRMVDFGAARRAHYFSITDSYSPLANRRAFWDTSYAMPPSMCECYVMAMPVKTIPQFRNMLRSGLMGWFTLMQDPAKWTAEQFAAAQVEFALYKTRLRALIRTANLYHASERPDGVRWDGLQYASQDGKRGVLYAFRGTTNTSSHTYPIRGLNPKATYKIRFADPGQAEAAMTGADLMAKGLTIKLGEPETSQLAFIDRF